MRIPAFPYIESGFSLWSAAMIAFAAKRYSAMLTPEVDLGDVDAPDGAKSYGIVRVTRTRAILG